MPHDFQLTEQQVSFFETFGYFAFPNLLADRIDETIREFQAVWEQRCSDNHGKPHDDMTLAYVLIMLVLLLLGTQ